jgi:hypothetical protein
MGSRELKGDVALTPIPTVAADPLTANHRATPRRGVVILSGLGTADRPLRAVRIVVRAAVRTAGDRGLRAESGDGHAERERRANQIPNKILQDELSLVVIGQHAPAI